MSNLRTFLDAHRASHPAISAQLCQLMEQIADVCINIAAITTKGKLSGMHGYYGDDAVTNVQGEAQKKLDVLTNDMFLACGTENPLIAAMASEEMEHAVVNTPQAPFLMVFDPLDGSSNTDVNVPVGSIFSILPAPATLPDNPDTAFLQTGTQQLAAGFALYGPATMLIITLGHGTHAFTLDPETNTFILTHPDIAIPANTDELSYNASNIRHWYPPFRSYIEKAMNGSRPNCNSRWIGSMVADAYRIMARGGVYLYPRDANNEAKGGRLRLLYEGNPIAMLMEQAGASATDTQNRILDIQPQGLHQRVGLAFGSREEITQLANHHTVTTEEYS